MTSSSIHRRNDSGVGLLEVLIALTILAVGIIGTIQLFPSALRQVQLGNERTVTSQLAAGNLGAIQSAGGDNLLVNRLERSQRLRSLPAGQAAEAIYGARGIYAGYTSSVQRMRGASRVYLQRVTMNVKMHDGRYEQYVTYVARP